MNVTPTYIVRFDGALTAEAPLTTTPPALKGRPYDTDRPLPMPKMVVTYGDSRATVPYMPGSGIRGHLRRCGVDIVRRAMPGGLRLQDYYYLAIGGVKGADSERKSDFAAAAGRRAANPLIGLFGAATPWMQGRLSVGHAVPRLPVAEQWVTGARLDDIGGSGSALTLLRAEDQAQWIEMAFHNAERSRKEAALRRLKADLTGRGSSVERTELQAAMEALSREISGHTARAYADLSVQRPLSGYEFIAPGTVLNQSMTLTHATALEIGAFVAILRAFALNPVLGGKVAHGNGVVSAKWTVSVRESQAMDITGRGAIQLTPFEPLRLDEAFLDHCAASFLEALDDGRFDFTAPDTSVGA
jgi:hypothetical protein